FPQREDADRRRAITPALVAMTVTHVERLTGRFDFHRSTITLTSMRFGHASTVTPRFALREQNYSPLIRSANCTRKKKRSYDDLANSSAYRRLWRNGRNC